MRPRTGEHVPQALLGGRLEARDAAFGADRPSVAAWDKDPTLKTKMKHLDKLTKETGRWK